ncbi:unnamed protein product [Oppiella nova]|uniref:Protein kinase domain-containing protein n=1 Tax=Oppiella nova TaxID=334625 RepID=A0A7R9LJ27_9ACAR|nr:unnamed protein product [Oppiella nova]CAG2164029.1 unnamed protein product [Oppiella nova]
MKDLNAYDKSRVLKEVNTLLTVQSEYVVKYYNSWNYKNYIYIQMELCTHNLTRILKNKSVDFDRKLGDPMNLSEYLISCEIFRQILECVQYLHELNPQIIHRDLKPDNILINYTVGNGRFVKLCDFGLATVHDKRVNYRTSHKHTADVGDVRYIAPEIYQGKKYGHKSDIYNLALIGDSLIQAQSAPDIKAFSHPVDGSYSVPRMASAPVIDFVGHSASTSNQPQLIQLSAAITQKTDSIIRKPFSLPPPSPIASRSYRSLPRYKQISIYGQRIREFINGSNFVLAINEDNHVFSWGHNSEGQLGRKHSLALTTDGQVYGWGSNNYGQVGCGINLFENHYQNLFEELSTIGSGGFGTVFKVKHKFDEHIYAIKRVEIKESTDEYMKQIMSEVKNLGKVRSEYCVLYYNSWPESKHLYIQMEFCLQNLRNILEVKAQVFGRQLGKAMDCVEYFISCEILRQILESVQYLHDLNPQIIHRDLKPENILMVENVRNGRFVMLCDFGLATVHDKNINYMTRDKHSTGLGTIKYQSPEISQGIKYGHKVDIYSLAIIGAELFELDLFFTDPDSSESVYSGNEILKPKSYS